MELPDSQSAGPGEPSRRLAAGLSKIAMAMRHHAWAATGASGLTPTQAQVLALLLARGEIGRAHV